MNKKVPCGAVAPLSRGWNSFRKRRAGIYLPGERRIFFDKIYMVEVMERQSKWGRLTLLAIRRRDGAEIHDWQRFQKIKNDIAGEHRVAIEIYPSELDLVEVPSTYYLWVLPEDFQLPFGLNMGEQ